jgi:hypothetical protein
MIWAALTALQLGAFAVYAAAVDVMAAVRARTGRPVAPVVPLRPVVPVAESVPPSAGLQSLAR